MAIKDLNAYFKKLMTIDDLVHVRNVGKVSVLIGKELGLSDEELITIHEAGLLHDVGKVKIEPEIINKNGKLTDEEYKMIQEHSRIGYEMFRKHAGDVPDAEELGKGILHHHERVDGNGYPEGLSGDKISLKAKIISVADVFDALIHDRPYKVGWTCQAAYDYVISMRGTMFDNKVVDAFQNVYTDIKSMYYQC